MTQRSVAVKERAIPFVLWQRSSLTPFRIYNQHASSYNHHRTYAVTRRIFVHSPLRCFHRKVWVIALRGRYKSNRRYNSRRTKRRYRLFASHTRYCVIPIRMISAEFPRAWCRPHSRSRAYALAQSQRQSESGRDESRGEDGIDTTIC
jgi:hypothetical protein